MLFVYLKNVILVVSIPIVRAHFLCVSYDFGLSALEREAAAADARWASRRPLSPFDGAPLLIKDEIDVRDMRTFGGTSFLGIGGDDAAADGESKACVWRQYNSDQQWRIFTSYAFSTHTKNRFEGRPSFIFLPRIKEKCQCSVPFAYFLMAYF